MGPLPGPEPHPQPCTPAWVCFPAGRIDCLWFANLSDFACAVGWGGVSQLRFLAVTSAGRARAACHPNPSPGPLCLYLDLASQEKERLEEKQRQARRDRAREEAEWQTR